MTRPRALDLFCCAGGASTGLHRAGFDVVGVDVDPQPRCPFEFHQADALTYPLDGFDFIWASPPCQAYSSAKRWTSVERSDLIEPTRQRLLGQPAPFVIENVTGAPVRADLVLTGQMFGLRVIKRRLFEMHRFWSMAPPPHPPGRIGFGAEDFVTVAGHGGNGSGRMSNWQSATGIDWMTKHEMAEAIPPAYAEFIGRAALAYMRADAD